MTKPSWGERRATKRAEKERERALAAWQEDHDLLLRAAEMVDRLIAGHGVATNAVLRPGETAVWSGPTELIEPRRAPGHYVGASSGVSFHVAKGVNYRVGATRGTYVQGDEVQSAVDSGAATVTTRRVVFTGTTATREWAFDKLVGMETDKRHHLALLHVSNRQKVSGLRTARDTTMVEALNVVLALAPRSGSLRQLAEEIAEQVREHERDRP